MSAKYIEDNVTKSVGITDENERTQSKIDLPWTWLKSFV